MPVRTVYCVETLRRRGGSLERAALRSYGTRGEALDAGRQVTAKTPLVFVYRIEVDPDQELCGEPTMLAERRDGVWRPFS